MYPYLLPMKILISGSHSTPSKAQTILGTYYYRVSQVTSGRDLNIACHQGCQGCVLVIITSNKNCGVQCFCEFLRMVMQLLCTNCNWTVGSVRHSFRIDIFYRQMKRVYMYTLYKLQMPRIKSSKNNRIKKTTSSIPFHGN